MLESLKGGRAKSDVFLSGLSADELQKVIKSVKREIKHRRQETVRPASEQTTLRASQGEKL